jgi:hypothetical protein
MSCDIPHQTDPLIGSSSQPRIGFRVGPGQSPVGVLRQYELSTSYSLSRVERRNQLLSRRRPLYTAATTELEPPRPPPFFAYLSYRQSKHKSPSATNRASRVTKVGMLEKLHGHQRAEDRREFPIAIFRTRSGNATGRCGFKARRRDRHLRVARSGFGVFFAHTNSGLAGDPAHQCDLAQRDSLEQCARHDRKVAPGQPRAGLRLLHP